MTLAQAIADCSIRYDAATPGTLLEGASNITGAAWDASGNLVLTVGAGLTGDEEVSVTLGAENNGPIVKGTIVPTYSLRAPANQVLVRFQSNQGACQSSATIQISRPVARPRLPLVGGPVPSPP